MKTFLLNLAKKIGRNPLLPAIFAIAMGPFVYYPKLAPGQHEALVLAGIIGCLFFMFLCVICSFFVKPEEIRL